eukprot:238026-Amphidinium_carterae.4
MADIIADFSLAGEEVSSAAAVASEDMAPAAGEDAASIVTVVGEEVAQAATEGQGQEGTVSEVPGPADGSLAAVAAPQIGASLDESGAEVSHVANAASIAADSALAEATAPQTGGTRVPYGDSDEALGRIHLGMALDSVVLTENAAPLLLDEVGTEIGRIRRRIGELRHGARLLMGESTTALWHQAWLLCWGSKKCREADLSCLVDHFCGACCKPSLTLERYIWCLLIGMLRAVKDLDGPYKVAQTYAAASQHKRVWDALLVAVGLPARSEIVGVDRIMVRKSAHRAADSKEVVADQRSPAGPVHGSGALSSHQELPRPPSSVPCARVPPPPPPPSAQQSTHQSEGEAFDVYLDLAPPDDKQVELRDAPNAPSHGTCSLTVQSSTWSRFGWLDHLERRAKRQRVRGPALHPWDVEVEDAQGLAYEDAPWRAFPREELPPPPPDAILPPAVQPCVACLPPPPPPSACEHNVQRCASAPAPPPPSGCRGHQAHVQAVPPLMVHGVCAPLPAQCCVARACPVAPQQDVAVPPPPPAMPLVQNCVPAAVPAPPMSVHSPSGGFRRVPAPPKLIGARGAWCIGLTSASIRSGHINFCGWRDSSMKWHFAHVLRIGLCVLHGVCWGTPPMGNDVWNCSPWIHTCLLHDCVGQHANMTIVHNALQHGVEALHMCVHGQLLSVAGRAHRLWREGALAPVSTWRFYVVSAWNLVLVEKFGLCALHEVCWDSPFMGIVVWACSDTCLPCIHAWVLLLLHDRDDQHVNVACTALQ